MNLSVMGMLPYYSNYQAALFPQSVGQTYMPYSPWQGTGVSFAGLLSQCLSAQNAKNQTAESAKSGQTCAVCGCDGTKQGMENLVDLIQDAYRQSLRSKWSTGMSASQSRHHIW